MELVKKVCKKCDSEKPITGFSKHKAYADGYSSWCKDCHNLYCAETKHRIQNRDRRRELRKDPEYRKTEQEREMQRRFVKWKEATISILKQRCKERNLEFNLTVDDIPDMPDLCPILEVPMIRRTPYAPSIDRKDPSKGYVKGNIQIISRKANTMKLNATKEELLKFSRYWLKALSEDVWTK